MADPLSIASGIAGLLSLGIQVTQSLVEFYTAYKNQDTDLAKLLQNVDILQSIFRTLDDAVEKQRLQADARPLLQQVDKAVQNCQDIIVELQEECEKFQKDSAIGLRDRVKVSGRRVAYPFRKVTLQKLEEDISDLREHLQLALDILQIKSQNKIQDSISEVKSLVERTNASHVSFAIRCWLMAPDASINHNAAFAKCHPSTGLWFINGDQFRTWLNEHNSFLWLNGFAGCGKTVLFSTAVQHTVREMSSEYGVVGIAFFYFSFGEEAKQDENGLLRTLLLQLSVQLQYGERYLEQLYALHKTGSPSTDVLLEALQQFLHKFSDTYILLDALDESPRNHKREGVLRAIHVMRSWSIPGVHILVTSRNELDIQEALMDDSCIQSVPLRNSGIDTDISNFVSDQLANDTKLQRWKASHAEIQEKLIAGAQGIFRYVECQFNALRRAKNRNQLDKCLHTLPRDLDETYERVLCNIDDDYIEDVRRVLTVLCLSPRPLTVSELIDAHAVDLSDPPHLDREGRSYSQEDMVDICLGLVEITATEDEDGKGLPIARIAHFSVQEYLQSDRIVGKKAKYFAIRSTDANTEMAHICLTYLTEPVLSEGVLNETKLAEFPLADFSATYWFHHYENSGVGMVKLEQAMLQLFKDKEKYFATWIRLHNIDDGPPSWQQNLQLPITKMATPFYYAALLGLESVLEHLLPNEKRELEFSELGKVQNGLHNNALQAASSGGYEKIVQILLDQGFDVNIHGGRSGSPLQAASYHGHENIVRILLDHGSDVNLQGGWLGNALQAASFEGHKGIVQMLLDHGSDIRIQSGWFGNALQAASCGGHQDLVRILLKQGFHVNIHGGHFGSPLQAASYRGHENIVGILFGWGADVNAQIGEYGNPLQAASYQGHDKLVRMLLDRGSDVNAQSGEYGNPLQAASLTGHEKVVQILLDHGVNVNARGGPYHTALQAASCRGHKKVVQMLIDMGADPNSRDLKGGDTPLLCAAIRGYDVIVKMLLDTRKVETRVKDNCGRTPLFLAARGGFETVVNQLVSEDSVLPDEKDHYGSTPLSIAVRHGHIEVVKVLLATGVVDCESRDCFSRSIVWWAKRGGHADIDKMLTDYAEKQGISMSEDQFVEVRSVAFDTMLAWCDVCTLTIFGGSFHYNCAICNGGELDICIECYELGGRCFQNTHTMLYCDRFAT